MDTTETSKVMVIARPNILLRWILLTARQTLRTLSDKYGKFKMLRMSGTLLPAYNLDSGRCRRTQLVEEAQTTLVVMMMMMKRKFV